MSATLRIRHPGRVAIAVVSGNRARVDARSGGEEGSASTSTLPRPERDEPRLADPGLTDLSGRDWRAIFQRAGKESLDDQVPMIASALAYSSFFAIPSLLLL